MASKPKKKNPRLASGRKRARQTVKLNAANTSLRSKYRTAVKNVEKAVLAGDKTKATELFAKAQSVLDTIAEQFTLPAHFGKNFDALYDCITDPLHKSGPQPGFIVVLEQIPTNARFDKETREQLLDIFREAADYWNDRKVAFRCFYSFL